METDFVEAIDDGALVFNTSSAISPAASSRAPFPVAGIARETLSASLADGDVRSAASRGVVVGNLFGVICASSAISLAPSFTLWFGVDTDSFGCTLLRTGIGEGLLVRVGRSSDERPKARSELAPGFQNLNDLGHK